MHLFIGRNARWIAILVFLSLFVPLHTHAKGSAESDFRKADGSNNWEYGYDISGFAPGKYNLIIEGRDKAGNVTYGGPYNVWVDPGSDLPVVGISNPTPGQRVGGPLNIVGTCRDDDGVDRVEVRLDDGEFQTVEGRESWSHVLADTAVSNGSHTITARGVDVNGTVGETVSVLYHLDTMKPLIRMTSHQSGTLASGALTFSGSVEDANGIRSLTVSTDGRKTFREQALRAGGDGTTGQFDLAVDTRNLPDGPQVYWFTGVDRTGSVGQTAFLFFVDNTGPVLDILAPAPGDKVNGRVDVAGRVSEKIGIRSLSYDAGGGDTGTIDLIPGNPYWLHTFDFTRVREPSARVVFTLVDLAGNATVKPVTIALDAESDLPTVVVLTPAADAVLSGDVLLSGDVRDDDGVKALRWSLDGQEAVTVPCTGAFSMILPARALAAGKHRLTVRGVDILDREGRDVAVTFLQTGAAPSIRMETATWKGNQVPVPVRAGLEVARETGVILAGRIVASGKLQAVESSINDSAPGRVQALGTETNGDTTFRVGLPAEIPFGLATIRVKATDEYGQTGQAVALLHVTNRLKRNVEPAVVFSDARIGQDGTVAVSAEAPLSGILTEEEIQSVVLEPATDVVAVSSSGDRILVTPLKPGISVPARVVVTTAKGHVFPSRELRFVTDAEKPLLTVTAPSGGDWVSRELVVAGNASDATGIAVLEYAVGGVDSFAAAELPAGDGSFRFTVALDPVPDGLILLSVRCRDRAGNTAVQRIAFRKDARAPEIVLLAPAENEEVRGSFLVAGTVSDAGRIAAVETGFDGKTWTLVVGTGAFAFPVDLSSRSPAPETVHVRVTDMAGNAATAVFPIRVAGPGQPAGQPPAVSEGGEAAKDKEKPVVTVLWPPKDRKLQGKVLFIGSARDNDRVLRLSFDAGTAGKGGIELIDGCPYWHKELDFSEERGIWPAAVFSAWDAGENRGDFRYAVALDRNMDLPTLSIAAPAPNARIDGEPMLFGSALDDDGMASALYSVDGGPTREIPDGDGFALELSELAAGPHRISLIAVDLYGTAGAKTEIPFTRVGVGPQIGLTEIGPSKTMAPYAAGMRAVLGADPVLRGRARVANPLRSAEYSVQGGAARPLSLRAETPGDYVFEVPLPADLPYARIEVRVSVVDTFDKRGEAAAWFWRTEADAGDARDGEGIVFADLRIDASGSALLAPGEGLQGRFNGRPPAEFFVSPATDRIRTSFDGNLLAVEAVKEGLTGEIRFHVRTVDGDAFQSAPFSLRVDAHPPHLEVGSPLTGDWAAGRIVLKGRAADANGIVGIGLSLGDGASLPVTAETRDGASFFEFPVDITDVPDGPIRLRVRAIDGAGRESSRFLTFLKDTKEPVLSLLTPPAEDPVNGLITVVGRTSDEGLVQGVEFSADGKTWSPVAGIAVFSAPLDLTGTGALRQAFSYRAADVAGNVGVLTPVLNVQTAMDVPEVQIQIPEENEVLRGDFTVSGMVFDDDGVGGVSYRIDGGAPVRLPGSSSFSVPIRLADMADNGHLIEVQAEDLNGVLSGAKTLTFRISRAEPTSRLLSPALDITVRDLVTLSGDSSDRNGIDEVFLSLDNSQTFGHAVLDPEPVDDATAWSYRFDTRILKDGTYTVFAKAIDSFGTEGLYTTLLNVDNTAPQIILDTPADGAVVSGSIGLNGRAWDNVQMTALSASIAPLADSPEAGGSAPFRVDLPVNAIFVRDIDASQLAPGWYNLVVEARDKADNATRLSRNIHVQDAPSIDRVDLWFPLEGETLAGNFALAGRILTVAKVTEVEVLVGGKTAARVPADEDGFFTLPVTPEILVDGYHDLGVRAALPDGRSLVSEARRIEYSASGPWIRVTSHSLGDFVSGRPVITGRVGWAEAPAAGDGTGAPAAAPEAHRVRYVEVSLDNGTTFQRVQGTDPWSFRLESQSMPDGDVRILARAVFAGGASAVGKTILRLDNTPPHLELLAPREEGRFNAKIAVTGTAQDLNGIAEVRAAVRQGDKTAYEVPTFIQGLYFEGHLMGATFWELGVGLTFFDDVVKLQAQVGIAPEGRFSGLVLGAKLLSNIARLPFSFLLGPDWDFLSGSLAVGANFSYVTNSGSTIAFTDKGLVLAAVVGQVEFPIVKIRSLSMFNTYSFYAEYQLWLISSDVSAGVMNKLAFGLRLGVF